MVCCSSYGSPRTIGTEVLVSTSHHKFNDFCVTGETTYLIDLKDVDALRHVLGGRSVITLDNGKSPIHGVGLLGLSKKRYSVEYDFLAR